jgi:hypothetical protein
MTASVVLRTFHRARTIVRLNEMYLRNVRPAIYRSKNGCVTKYIPYKTDYEPGCKMSQLFEMSAQTDQVMIDLDNCSAKFPTQYVSLVGIDTERPEVIDSLYLCYKPLHGHLKEVP